MAACPLLPENPEIHVSLISSSDNRIEK